MNGRQILSEELHRRVLRAARTFAHQRPRIRLRLVDSRDGGPAGVLRVGVRRAVHRSRAEPRSRRSCRRLPPRSAKTGATTGAPSTTSSSSSSSRGSIGPEVLRSLTKVSPNLLISCSNPLIHRRRFAISLIRRMRASMFPPRFFCCPAGRGAGGAGHRQGPAESGSERLPAVFRHLRLAAALAAEADQHRQRRHAAGEVDLPPDRCERSRSAADCLQRRDVCRPVQPRARARRRDRPADLGVSRASRRASDGSAASASTATWCTWSRRIRRSWRSIGAPATRCGKRGRRSTANASRARCRLPPRAWSS